MRHNRDEKRFNRRYGHLRCMMANMTSDLIIHERVRTTTPKAKELRRYADRMITLGKAGDLAARRRAMAFMRSKEAVTKLFDDVALRFKTRSGGYTRLMKCGFRPGDCSPMSFIELVEKGKIAAVAAPEAKTEKPVKEKKAAAPKKEAAPKKKPAAKKAAPKKEAKKKA